MQRVLEKEKRGKNKEQILYYLAGALFTLDRATKKQKSSQEFPVPAIESREKELGANKIVEQFQPICFHGCS